MTDDRLADYLRHVRQAAQEACSFVEGLRKEHFLADRRTQNAVLMCMMVIGEAATQLMDRYPEFTDRYPDVPWRNMRGMRNRIAHGLEARGEKREARLKGQGIQGGKVQGIRGKGDKGTAG